MVKELKVDTKTVRVDTSCGFLVVYLNQFNSDPLVDIFKFRQDPFLTKSESKIIILKLFWALAKNNNNKIKPPEEWLKKFKINYIELAVEIFSILTETLKIDTKSKYNDIENIESQGEGELKTTYFIASALAYGFSLKDFCKMDLGNYIKVCKEIAKIKGFEADERDAEQSDFDNF